MACREDIEKPEHRAARTAVGRKGKPRRRNKEECRVDKIQWACRRKRRRVLDNRGDIRRPRVGEAVVRDHQGLR